MAHGSHRRSELRGLYVYKRLSMETACAAMGVGKTTANNWKREAREKGDDWDSARAAVALGDAEFTQLSRRLLEDYLVQHQAAIDMLRDSKDMPAAQRVQLLASLGDSFHKTLSAFKKVAPELNRHAVALDTLQRLATFAQRSYPQNVPGLIEMLEPFGEELAKAYG